MRSQFAFDFGRIVLSPRPPVIRPQAGGGRPPRDVSSRRRPHSFARFRSSLNHRHRTWLRPATATFAALTIAACFAPLPLFAAQQGNSALPNLAGTYRCDGNESACGMTGRTLTVTQEGADLQIKNDKGEIGSAKLTSSISLSAGPIWNMFGVLSPDNRAIQWSNGTNWRKQ